MDPVAGGGVLNSGGITGVRIEKAATNAAIYLCLTSALVRHKR